MNVGIEIEMHFVYQVVFFQILVFVKFEILEKNGETSVYIYDNEIMISEVYIKNIPTHLGRIFIPNTVFQKIKAEGNIYKVELQLRENSIGTRTYSNKVRIDQLPPIGVDCPTSPVQDCAATFDMVTNTLHIPNFQNTYWLNFGLISWETMQFELKDVGEIE